MSDIADAADNQVEQFQQHAASQRRPAGPPFTGWCLWCEDEVPAPRRWCCADCRDGWELSERRRDGNR